MDHADHLYLLKEGIPTPGGVWGEFGSGRGAFTQALAELIEQRVRTALHRTRSAYTAIRLSRQASDAAESNFVVVRDAYSRGTVSILDLLDAQNAALVADLRAATAVYEFVRALMEVERAAARFDFFLTPQDQSDWFTRVDRYFTEHGVQEQQR